MDSQGRKVVVCDNGTGVSRVAVGAVKVSLRDALGSPAVQFDEETGRARNRK